MRRRFWKALALFAYRRWAPPGAKKPTGIPGNRDPKHPCHAYDPRPGGPGIWGDCETDGHYLCVGCSHLSAESEYAYAHGLSTPPSDEGREPSATPTTHEE